MRLHPYVKHAIVGRKSPARFSRSNWFAEETRMMESIPREGGALKRRGTAFENTCFWVFADHIADLMGNEIDEFLVVVSCSQRRNLLTGFVVIPWQDGQMLF